MMFIAWDPGSGYTPPGVKDVAVALDDRHVTLQAAGVRYVWNAGNQWRIPVMDIATEAWVLLPMVGGLELVDDSGEPVGDGALPATRPEAT